MLSTGPDRADALRYRPHIDGLRAIAVVGVILYHAKLLGFIGGFVGVDIFFVISGFLITSIVARDLREGVFSLSAFWERRARRILPALTVVMLCTIIAAYFIILYPYDYHHFGSSVMAQSVFVSNMLFMVSDNYFDQPSIHSPLLHTWTLSVEEQFYVVFPLIVLLCAWIVRRARGSLNADAASRKREWMIFLCVAVIGVVSFLLNIWLVHIRPGAVLNTTFMQGYDPIYYATAGFYLLPARAWEFALGASITLLSLRIRSSRWAEAVTAGGVLSILGSMFLLSDSTAFPGFAALLPTVGTMGIIVANEGEATFTGRVLSIPFLVSIGLISYSLYLWHWPILVFASLLSPVPISVFYTMGLITLTCILSLISYRFVETPFRNKKGIVRSRKIVFALAFCSISVLMLLGFLQYRNYVSNASRIPVEAKATLAILDAARTTLPGRECFQLPGDESQYGGLCRIGDKNSSEQPKFIIWGDSHAQVLITLFDAMARRLGMQGVVFFDSSCIPVTGVALPTQKESCGELRKNALAYITDKDIKNVFLVASWSSYIVGGPDHVRGQRIAEQNTMSTSPEQAQGYLQKYLTPLLQKLTDEKRKVYIMKQVPEQLYFDPRKAFYRSVATKEEIEIQGISAAQNIAYRTYADSVIDTVAQIRGVQSIDPTTILCRGDSGCPLRFGETLLYRDIDHVSPSGSMLLEPLFMPILKSLR